MTNATTIQERGLYGVTKGPRRGSYYLLIGQKGLTYTFLILPEFKQVALSERDIKIGIVEGVLELIKVLPNKIFMQTVQEYNERKISSSTPLSGG